MKEIRVSDYIDINDIKQNELNLIVAGCGTGKSYFALVELLYRINSTFNCNIKPCECWFVTSRALTKKQQIEDEDYVKIVSKLNKFHIDYLDINEEIDRELFSSGWGTVKEKKDNAINTIPIMTYNQFSYCMTDNINEHIKIIIFDEIHSIISDSYNPAMNYSKDFIFDKLKNKNNSTYIIGMTATDEEVNSTTMHVKVNYLLDKPLYKYKVTKSLTTITRPALTENILREIDGITFVMGFASDDVIKLKEKLGDTAVALVSEKNKHYNDDMKKLRDYIIENKSLPPGIKYFIATSCAREGFEFNASESFKVKNIFVYGGLVVDVIQFVGRFRGNVENLYLVNDYRKTTNTQAQKDQLKLFKDFVFRCDTDKSGNKVYETVKYKRYIKMISSILHDNIEIKEYNSDNALYNFLTWFNSEWTDRLIWKKEQKEEIKNKANSLGLRKEKGKLHSFNSVIELLVENRFDLEWNGNVIRKNNDIVQQYKYDDEIIDKDRIRPYIVKENYCYMLY